MDQIYTIAEVGQAHEGSLGIAHSYIDALKGTGVDAVKFQMHIAEAESSKHEPFRVKFSFEDPTRFDYWKRMEFTEEQWGGLKKHCEDNKLEFIASPFSNAAVNLLRKLGVQKYKIGSGEVTNFLMMDCISRTGKEIILSSGMSSFNELDAAVDFISGYGNRISILQCTTAYPTVPGQWGLNVLQEFRQRYKMPIGFSDHSGDIHACLAATALGAEILEFHAVFDKRMFGPDAQASLEINQIKKLVKGVKQIAEDLRKPLDKDNTGNFRSLKLIFEKSLAVNKDLTKGHVISMNDLESKKPAGKGIDARLFQSVIGKRVKSDLKKWDFLTDSHIDG